jgi:sterol desaturase/sphingolipid hydroxylase (fatty acid hydroxylase superfamily)
LANTTRAPLAALSLFFLMLATRVLAQPAVLPPDSVNGNADAALYGWLVCLGISLVIGLAGFIFWLVMLIDCFKRETDEFPKATENTKTVWTIVLLVSWLVGLFWFAAILYFFMVRRALPRRARV